MCGCAPGEIMEASSRKRKLKYCKNAKIKIKQHFERNYITFVFILIQSFPRLRTDEQLVNWWGRIEKHEKKTKKKSAYFTNKYSQIYEYYFSNFTIHFLWLCHPSNSHLVCAAARPAAHHIPFKSAIWGISVLRNENRTHCDFRFSSTGSVPCCLTCFGYADFGEFAHIADGNCTSGRRTRQTSAAETEAEAEGEIEIWRWKWWWLSEQRAASSEQWLQWSVVAVLCYPLPCRACLYSSCGYCCWVNELCGRGFLLDWILMPPALQ